jgi:hypothetical protein
MTNISRNWFTLWFIIKRKLNQTMDLKTWGTYVNGIITNLYRHIALSGHRTGFLPPAPVVRWIAAKIIFKKKQRLARAVRKTVARRLNIRPITQNSPQYNCYNLLEKPFKCLCFLRFLTDGRKSWNSSATLARKIQNHLAAVVRNRITVL